MQHIHLKQHLWMAISFGTALAILPRPSDGHIVPQRVPGEQTVDDTGSIVSEKFNLG